MSKLINTNVSGFVKDSETNVVLNTNFDDLNKFKQEREKIKKQREQNASLETVKSEVNDLKSELSEIKTLLMALVKDKNI